MEGKPYRGPRSFELEDSRLFYGRDDATARLVTLVLSGGVSLLHAQSGAGKTSVLNARLLPELERRGWTPVKVRPGNEPSAELRESILATLLPGPINEAAVLEGVCSAIGVGRDATLGDLLKEFDRLSPRDPRWRCLGIGREPDDGGAKPQRWMATRLLSAALDVDRFASYVRALWHPIGSPPPLISDEIRMDSLIAILRDQELDQSHRSLLASLQNGAWPGENVAASDDGGGPVARAPSPHALSALLARLLQDLKERGDPRRVVLVFDQFEEMFTRFIDTTAAGTASSAEVAQPYQKRDHLLAEIRGVIADSRPTPIATGEPVLPIRCVFSMRSEYIARLGDTLGDAVPGLLAERAFNLPVLTREEASDAIAGPAKSFGYGYTDGCLDALISQLTKEGHWVEPAHLQIVCEKLWSSFGQQLVGLEGKVGLQELTSLRGVAGILSEFFNEFLATLGPYEVYEVLEMLERLVTREGTRNIVEKSALLAARLRDGAFRSRMLAKLENHNIVRVETRLGSEFVEITHEFLIKPIQEASLNRLRTDPAFAEQQRLRLAMDRLSPRQVAGVDQKMTEQEFLDLHRYREKVLWLDWAKEVMLRAAIWLDDRQAIRAWVDEMATGDGASDLVSLLSQREALQTQFTGGELRSLREHRHGLRISASQMEAILRSALTVGDVREIRFWSREMCDHAIASP